MYGPRKILTWLEPNVQMRRSRKQTRAAIVSGAMRMQGSGVLALGRSMEDTVSAKHRIKRVDRFWGNPRIEIDAVSQALFHQFCPGSGPVVVLADWTDRHPFQQLVLAVPCNGRAISSYWVTVEKGDGSGAHKGRMVRAEKQALDALAQFCADAIVPVIVADRGFGNTRWLGDIQNRGWQFVQRISAELYVETEHYVGALHELGIRRGWKPRDYGKGTITNAHFGEVRLCAAYDRDAKEPWILVSNLEQKKPGAIVSCYRKRMWIEAMFRDLKNRQGDWAWTTCA